MKGPAESGQICSVGRRKIAKKIAKTSVAMPPPLTTPLKDAVERAKRGVGGRGVITRWLILGRGYPRYLRRDDVVIAQPCRLEGGLVRRALVALDLLPARLAKEDRTSSHRAVIGYRGYPLPKLQGNVR